MGEPPPAGDTGPQIGTLTAANLAQHAAALRPPDNVDALDVTTLGYADAEARKQAYLERKQARNKARKQPSLPGAVGEAVGPGAPADRPFLSKVHEVEADVQYRFNFLLIGPGSVAAQVAALACNSPAAGLLGGNTEEPPSADRPVAPHQASCRPAAPRCLCTITPPPGEKQKSQKLAKLVFDTLDFGMKLPSCASRLEALSTAMVFLLVIDGPLGRNGGFAEQLQSLVSTVEQNRQETHAKFRPVRAVILASTEASNTLDCEANAWVAQWALFEQEQGDTWKFGPMAMQDSDAFHAAFAEMATTRIAEGRCSTAAACEPVNEADEEEAVKLERQLLEQRLQERERETAVRRVPSRTGSEYSEGWQQPPVFDAEVDGSACSEGALEAYAQWHGLERDKLWHCQDVNKDIEWDSERFDGVCAHPETSPVLDSGHANKQQNEQQECGSLARRVCAIS